MARRVFFSFQYDDVQRAMQVRNSNVIPATDATGFVDKAEFEQVERQGDAAIRGWIDRQLNGTSVTVVLVGASTSRSRWVQYEIEKSIARGNGLITVDISGVRDLRGETTSYCGLTVPGYAHYDWVWDGGRTNLGGWVEKAARQAGL